MSRATLTAAEIVALAAQAVNSCWLVKLQYPTGTLFATTCTAPINYGGQLWIAGGTVGSVGAVSEASDLSVQNLQLTLNGVPTAIIADVLPANRQRAPAWLHLVLMNEIGIISAVRENIYVGFVDTFEIDVGVDACGILVNLENSGMDMRRAVGRTYNSADQKADFPDDTAFDGLELISITPIVWPSKEFFLQT